MARSNVQFLCCVKYIRLKSSLNIVPVPSGHISAGSMSGVNLALGAVNLAEAAGNAVSRGMMAEIYATAGVTTRLHFPASLQIITVS